MSTTCEFRFGFWDVTARADAAFQVSDNQPWARIEDINLEDGAVFPDVATLEPGFGWPLNGSKVWMPDSPSANTWGWWSTDLSQADKSFAHPPTLTVTFTENHSSAGITFRFVATLPKTVNIKWYSLTGVLLADRNFTPDRMEYFCDYQVENYGKVIVTIPAMSAAHRYLRCSFILFGVLEIIDGQRVQKAELREEVGPVALTLPINTLNLSFFTPGGRFSLLDPSEAYRLFQWKQQITAFATVNEVQRPLGVYYLQEASGLVDSLVDLQLVDIVGVLDTLEYDGGIYTAVPIRELLDAILAPEDVGYTLDPSFEGITITGYLPICSKREALQQIAFALGAVVDTTRGEVMRFYPMPSSTHHTIAPDRKIVGHKVTLEELVTRVDAPAAAKRYLNNLRRIRNALDLFASTPPAPSGAAPFTAQEANNIEQILVDVERILDRVVAAFRRSGAYMFFAGNEPLPSAASDIGRNWEELDAMNTTWSNWQEAAWYLLLYGNLNAEGVAESCP